MNKENCLTHCGLVMPYGYRGFSTLAQVMACCLLAPSHYPNQCWHIINGILLHSPGGQFHRNCSRYQFMKKGFEYYLYIAHATSPGDQCFNNADFNYFDDLTHPILNPDYRIIETLQTIKSIVQCHNNTVNVSQNLIDTPWLTMGPRYMVHFYEYNLMFMCYLSQCSAVCKILLYCTML